MHLCNEFNSTQLCTMFCMILQHQRENTLNSSYSLNTCNAPLVESIEFHWFSSAFHSSFSTFYYYFSHFATFFWRTTSFWWFNSIGFALELGFCGNFVLSFRRNKFVRNYTENQLDTITLRSGVKDSNHVPIERSLFLKQTIILILKY